MRLRLFKIRAEHFEPIERPLKSRGMATRPGYVNSRQEQYKLDQQLMRELRNDKNYETKWFTVGEIGLGDVAVRKIRFKPC